MVRTGFAVIAGGLALFIWSFLSWVILPIHSPHMKQLPQEDAALSMLQSTIAERGVYFFPSMSSNASPAEMEAATEKYRKGPTGFMVFDPSGNEPFDAAAMGLSFLFELLAVAVGIWLYKRSTAPLGTFLARTTYFGVIGVLISIAVYLQEWIHLKFPLPYMLGFCVDAIAGWLLAGIVIALILRPVVKTENA